MALFTWFGRDNAADRHLIESQLTPKGRKLFENIGPLALPYKREALSALLLHETALFRNLIGEIREEITAFLK